jgi:hypothetical protein
MLRESVRHPNRAVKPMKTSRVLIPWICAMCAGALLACGRSHSASSAPASTAPADAIPPRVEVTGTALTTGFATSVARGSAQLDTFRISVSPITNGDYARGMPRLLLNS